MRVISGGSRLVVVLPKLGVVVKFPRIHLVDGVRIVCRQARQGKLLQAWKRKMYLPGSIRGPFFLGITINWYEFLFYMRTHHTFLQPTYFSLFGLLNVQCIASVCTASRLEIWEKMYKVAGDGLYKDAHHFDNPKNFAVVDGKLKMLDYGWVVTQQIIREFGVKMAENAD